MPLSRRALLAGATALAITPLALEATMPSRLPALFVGHGSPMNAIEDNRWSRAFRALGGALPHPRAVLAISAHWHVDGTWLTADDAPRTIHDFGGFPQALFEVQYPAAGHRDLASRVAELLASRRAALSTDWGLDHGTWSVMRHLFPDADVPVVQLSLDRRLTPEQHVATGRALRDLRDQGVLLLGSGNITHNLRDAFGQMRAGTGQTPDWARRFDDQVTQAASQHDADALAALVGTDDGRLAHPSVEHYLPLLVIAGAAGDDDDVSSPITGFDWGSLSMRAMRWG